MSETNTKTSLGKIAVIIALIPLFGILICLLPFLFGDYHGESGLAAMVIVAVIIFGGAIGCAIASTIGLICSIAAICKTHWKKGIPGLVINIPLLITAGGFLSYIYYEKMTDPNRIIIASRQGKFEDVNSLIHKGFNVNYQIGNDTALCCAAQRSDYKMALLLLNNGADVNLGNPIEFAAQHGNEEMTILLLDHGADPNCLHSAVSGRNIKMVKLLLQHGADIHIRGKYLNIPLLHLAVISGTAEITEFLINNGADVNSKDHQGDTPLHTISASYPQIWWTDDFRKNIVGILLKHGAEIEAVNKKGQTPLCLAAESGHRDSIKLLLENNAKPENIPDINLRFTAAPLLTDKEAMKKWVLANTNNINLTNKEGLSLLHSGVIGGNSLLVECMVELGADINTANQNGDTPLHLAAKTVLLPSVVILIKTGAQIDIQNNDGSTPLHLAASAVCIADEKLLADPNKIKIIEVLLENGASLKIKDKHGNTPMDNQKWWLPETIIGKQYNKEVIALFKKYNNDSN